MDTPSLALRIACLRLVLSASILEATERPAASSPALFILKPLEILSNELVKEPWVEFN
jgi:hypothetical protein